MTPTDNYISEAPSKDTQFSEILELAKTRFDEYFYDSSHSLNDRQVGHIWVALVEPLLLSSLTKAIEADRIARFESVTCMDCHAYKQVMVCIPCRNRFRDAAIKETMEKIRSKVGFLRQWLNEKPENRLVTNEDIDKWLGLIGNEAIEQMKSNI